MKKYFQNQQATHALTYNVKIKFGATEMTHFTFKYTLKMLGCFNPTLGQIWTNPNFGLKM